MAFSLWFSKISQVIRGVTCLCPCMQAVTAEGSGLERLWLHIKALSLTAGKTAQWLGALTVLPEDPGFNSQHLHGSLQLFVTPVPRHLACLHRHKNEQIFFKKKDTPSSKEQTKNPIIQNKNKKIKTENNIKICSDCNLEGVWREGKHVQELSDVSWVLPDPRL